MTPTDLTQTGDDTAGASGSSSRSSAVPRGAKPLVIVESPAKAKTIAGLLGSDYVVESSIGHIRDLPRRADEVPASVKGEPWAYDARVTLKKQITRLTGDGLPVHSFHSLLADLATLARNTIVTAITPNLPLTVLTRPTPIQHKAFTLLRVAM